MARKISTTMQSILDAMSRKIDYTIRLTFPDASELNFATAPLTLNEIEYTNDLESVSEIRQTLENPVDRVSVALQNKDRVLSLHIAANIDQWRKAEAVIGRYYHDADGLALAEWVEMFRGAVQQPNIGDLQVSFDIIPDTTAPGEIVCNRTLASACGFVFKDSNTCAYSGSETVCDHHLKSIAGCDGRGNSEHFGGMEHRYPPSSAIPGTGGNPGGSGGSGGGNCPSLDQWILVRGRHGQIRPIRVSALQSDNFLFNPITETFHKIKSLEIIRNEPIFEMNAANGAKCYSSRSHKVLWYREHVSGEVVTRFIKGDPILTLVTDYPNWTLTDSKTTSAADTGVTGDVTRIEMADGFIYACGDSFDKFIVAHNTKNPIEIIIV